MLNYIKYNPKFLNKPSFDLKPMEINKIKI